MLAALTKDDVAVDVALVYARIVSKRVFAYSTVLHHVAVGSTVGGLSFGRDMQV